MAKRTDERSKDRESSRPAEPDGGRRMVERQDEARKGAVTYRPSDRPRPEPPAASTPGGRDPGSSDKPDRPATPSVGSNSSSDDSAK